MEHATSFNTTRERSYMNFCFHVAAKIWLENVYKEKLAVCSVFSRNFLSSEVCAPNYCSMHCALWLHRKKYIVYSIIFKFELIFSYASFTAFIAFRGNLAIVSCFSFQSHKRSSVIENLCIFILSGVFLERNSSKHSLRNWDMIAKTIHSYCKKVRPLWKLKNNSYWPETAEATKTIRICIQKCSRIEVQCRLLLIFGIKYYW